MATFNEKRNRWDWTPLERQERQPGARKVQKTLEKLQEQVRRMKSHQLPFLGQAEEAVGHLAAGLGQLATLNLSSRGPKYLPLSPEEVDRILAGFPKLMEPWEQLARSPDFIAAVRRKNREVRAHNARVREHNRAVEAEYAAMWQRFNEVLRKVDQGDISGSLDKASDLGIL